MKSDLISTRLKPDSKCWLSWSEDWSNRLYNNRQLLQEYLDVDKKTIADQLIQIFLDIDEGDRISNEKPETINKLDTALTFYSRAAQKAKGLPPDIDAAFISEIKTSTILDRKARLETRNKKQTARKTYSQIISFINPSEWERARNLLYDHRQLLTEYLENETKTNAGHLIQFFRKGP